MAACASPGEAPPDGALPSPEDARAEAHEPPWPTLPTTEARAQRLIEARQRRPGGPTEPFDAAVAAELLDRHGVEGAQAGHEAIVRWFEGQLQGEPSEREVFLLFGSYHDSGGQLRAFRRLVGPQGIGGLTVIGVEQLSASGAWRGVAAEAQRGDDEALSRWLEGGEPSALSELLERQRRRNYTAWRYGYLQEVADLLVQARGLGLPLVGCDLPEGLLSLTGALSPPSLDRVRELHCLLSLSGDLRPRRGALFWGDAHLSRSGLRRFLAQGEARVIVVHLVGHRGPLHPEGRLRESVALASPLLLPTDEEDELALLLPGPLLAAEVERSRSPPRGSPGVPPPQLTLRIESTARGELCVEGRAPVPISDDEVRAVTLSRSSAGATFGFRSGGLWLLGELGAQRCSTLELSFDPPARRIRSICFEGGPSERDP